MRHVDSERAWSRRWDATSSRPRSGRPRAHRRRRTIVAAVSGHRAVVAFDDVSGDALADFADTGWLLVSTLDASGVRELQEWVDEIASWPDEGEGWIHHREMTGDGPKLCRSENLIPFHAELRALLTTGSVPRRRAPCSASPRRCTRKRSTTSCPAAPDTRRTRTHLRTASSTRHVSCMLAIDDSTADNGCLEVVSGMHRELLPTDSDGCIRADVAEGMQWAPVEVRAGETLWFHSRTPHRSGPNRSQTARRALYPTYNAASEGDRRADYYRDKLASFAASEGGDKVRVSLIGDFQGRPV